MTSRLWFALPILLLGAGIPPATAQQKSCNQLYEEYQRSPPPKAWAHASNDRCGYASALSASNVRQARSMALGYCQQFGGVGCRIVSSQSK